jgi:uncharacterized protein (TIGR03083 family)
MTDERDLQGLDPYDLFDAEADRLSRFFTSIDAPVWSRSTRCEGWSVRDVLGHLRFGEDYNQASLDGSVQDFLVQMGSRGATDLDAANALGVADYAGVPTEALVEEWRTVNADTRKRLRDRDGGEVDSTVGGYPARWQAFHLAAELAPHADDIAVPIAAGEEPDRTRWRAAFSRFAVRETKPDVEVEAVDGGTRYRAGDETGTIDDRDLVEVVAAREPRDASIPAPVRDALRALA